MKLLRRNDDKLQAERLAIEIDAVRRIMERSASRRPPVFAAPTHCPDCGEWGLVDSVTAVASENHCYFCHAEWLVTRRAIAAVAAEPISLHPSPAAQAGVLHLDAVARSRHPSAGPAAPSGRVGPSDQPAGAPRRGVAPVARLRSAVAGTARVEVVGI